MAAEVPGSAFKFVIGSLLGAELLFPDLRDRVATMDDNTWYSWADYVAATQEVAAMLDHQTVVTIGSQIMMAARSLLEAQGFATPTALLSDWQRVMEANIRGLTPQQQATTLRADATTAVIDYGTELPAALIEGYLRGAVLAFGRRVQGFSAHLVQFDGVERLRCVVQWR